MEERGEVCLAEEAARLWRSGMGVEEVSRRMGVDVSWVRAVVEPLGRPAGPEPEGPASGAPEAGA